MDSHSQSLAMASPMRASSVRWQFTGSYFLALMFFAASGIALLVCSLSIDYARKLPV